VIDDSEADETSEPSCDEATRGKNDGKSKMQSPSQSQPRPQKPLEATRPRGRAPKGMQWNGIKKKWVSETLKPTVTKTSSSSSSSSSSAGVNKRPRGRAPKGKRWCKKTGDWVIDV